IVSYTNGTATFTPADNLAPLTTYTVTINTGAKDLAGNALTSDIRSEERRVGTEDTTAPVLGASGPANGDTNVPLNETITVTFSEPMEPATINTSTFIVMQGTTPVAGTVTYTNGTATFTPADNLAPLTTYTVTINTGAKDLAGNALTSDITWNFSRAVAPTTTTYVLRASGPASGDPNIPPNETITATFRDPIDPPTFPTRRSSDLQGTTPVAGTVTYTNGTATFTPADNLAPLTTYTVTINTGAKDLAGNALASDISW